LYHQPSETAAPAAVEPAPAEEVKEEKVRYSSNAMDLYECSPLFLQKEEKKEEKKDSKGLKLGRRLSARVGDLFKSTKRSEVSTPAKVDENPPKIDEPAPVAPLENPASESAPEATHDESVEPVEAAPAAVPVVAAAA